MKLQSSLVSVIIPTRNSQPTLVECLKSIRNQTYPHIETIVVDSFSNDETRKIAESYGAKVLYTCAGRSEARNLGAEKARGAWVLFVDSDMELGSSVVCECVRKIKQGYEAIIIPEISVGEGFWAECKSLEKFCYLGDDAIEAARFFDIQIFRKVGGYDPRLEAGEDWDLSQRIRRMNYSIGRIKESIKHHERRVGLRETVIKKSRYGAVIAPYRRKNPMEAKQQLTLLRSAYARNWQRLAKDPLHAAGLVIMKNCEFCAGALKHLSKGVSVRNDKPKGSK